MDRHNTTGIGLRPDHFADFLKSKPAVGWLEVHSENYFNPYSLAHKVLLDVMQEYPVSLHGIGLSLGTAQPLNRQHLKDLVNLVETVNPVRVSDHLSWSAVDGRYFNDLLPIPYTRECIDVLITHILEVQDAIKRPLLIENPSSYLSFTRSDMTEWDFLFEIQKHTDCKFLFDINNIYVTAANTGMDTQAYLSAIALHPAIEEIHLAGFSRKQTDRGEVLIDTHSRPVDSQVWQLYRQFVEMRHHAGLVIPDTLIEWDLDLPDLQVLVDEAQKAQQIIDTSCIPLSQECP